MVARAGEPSRAKKAERPSRDELIERMRSLSAESGARNVPKHRFLRATGVSERYLLRTFGTYNALVEAAGLEPRHFPIAGERVFSDDELLDEVVRILRLPKSKLTRIFFEQNASVSSSVCERRFGGWLNTLRIASERLDPNRDRDLIQRLSEYTPPALAARQSGNASAQVSEGHVPEDDVTPEHPGHAQIGLVGANIYGDFINFRGLQHAPVNEQGVVFLFGMVCRELGYIVESVRSGFPDCEAKRRIRGAAGKWQRVRIEFEYQSRTFQAHGHDPDLCDIVVCWEDNWPNSPIEVLELRSALQKLSSGL